MDAEESGVNIRSNSHPGFSDAQDQTFISRG
jgi:hypothetical protein